MSITNLVPRPRPRSLVVVRPMIVVVLDHWVDEVKVDFDNVKGIVEDLVVVVVVVGSISKSSNSIVVVVGGGSISKSSNSRRGGGGGFLFDCFSSFFKNNLL